MSVQISGVQSGSIAAKHGIMPNETLLAINGHPINDVLDYRFYMTDAHLALSMQGKDGAAREIRIKKREYDDLGLEFETYLMDKQHFCKNKCVFCFIDQMPKGMRESLYFKDDDSRMGFLFGNYITLTNLRDEDVDRIIAMKTSPVNISVHTMNPDLRVKMMKNPRAGEVLGYIKRLTGAGIKVNAQLVLCPDVNDGAELTRSLRELCALAPNLQSVAAVPVGLTKHRDKLEPLRLFNAESAARVIETIDAFAAENQKTHGARICHAADEFYYLAGTDFPPYEDYGDFAQLENGVGLIALLERDFSDALTDEEARTVNRRITMATGVLAAPFIARLAGRAMQAFEGLTIAVTAIENKLFGKTITVAGLVTATDLIEQLQGRDLGGELLIPAVMLRRERDLFLDGKNVTDVEHALGCKLRCVENDGYELLAAMLGEKF